MNPTTPMENTDRIIELIASDMNLAQKNVEGTVTLLDEGCTIPFTSRAQLKKVPRLGPAAFTQCAGFLRIPEATNPLDGSAVHPERYAVVEAMAKDCHCSVSDLMQSAEKRKQIDLKRCHVPNKEVADKSLFHIVQPRLNGLRSQPR